MPMSSSRLKKTAPDRRRRPRFTKARPPAPEKKRPTGSRGVVAKRRAAEPETPTRAGLPTRTGLPGWDELASAGRNERQAKHGHTVFEGMSTVRFGLFLLFVAAAFTLYIGHVHASQALLSDVQRMQRENLSLHLKYNRLKGEFDRRTGPAVIYRRAQALGLVADAVYGPTIEVK